MVRGLHHCGAARRMGRDGAILEDGLETYYFSSTSRGGEMAETMTKFGNLISKASVYRAACRNGE